MKLKFAALLLLSCLFCGIVNGQDRIVKKDGEVVLAKVVACTNQEVRFMQAYTSKDGQAYIDESTVHVMQLDKVESVELESGKIIYQEKKSIAKDPLNPHIYPRYKSPALAFACSTVPGLGQFYNDEIGKGFTFMVTTDLAVAATYFFAAHTDFPPILYVLTGSIATGLYVWQMVDAVTTADEKNKKNGYVVSLAPSLQYNSFAATNGASGIAPSLSLSISF